MSNKDHWLLKERARSTYPTSKEYIILSGSVGRKAVELCVEHPKIPGLNSDGSDIALYVPGWTEKDLAECRRSTAIRGMTSASISHPRDGALKSLFDFVMSAPNIAKNWNQLSDSIWHAHDIEQSEKVLADMFGDFENSSSLLVKKLVKDATHAGKRRRENIEEAIQNLAEQGYTVHLLGHSLGGIDATLAATGKPHLIRSLGLIGAGGLIEDDSLTDILPRIIKTGVGEGVELTKSPTLVIKTALKSLLFVAENPALTIIEGHYAAAGRLHGQIKNLVLDNNLPIVNILGSSDPMFPIDRVIKSTQDSLIADTVIFDQAGHNMTRYQSGGVAIVAINMASDLRQRRSSQLEAQMHGKIENYKTKEGWLTEDEILKQLTSNN